MSGQCYHAIVNVDRQGYKWAVLEGKVFILFVNWSVSVRTKLALLYSFVVS